MRSRVDARSPWRDEFSPLRRLNSPHDEPPSIRYFDVICLQAGNCVGRPNPAMTHGPTALPLKGILPDHAERHRITHWLNEGLMKKDKKKEIEAKWNQLIAETVKSEKPKVETKTAASSAKVIRRRKGNPDLHIA